MSLSAFVPANSQKARTTAISAFVQILEDEGVSIELSHVSILNDPSTRRMTATMNYFGYYLATNDGKKARASSDYQDAALACIMWHCFGRSSDLSYLRKQHVSVSADALVMQTASCSALLSQLPQLGAASEELLVPGVSLHKLLEAEPALLKVAPKAPSTATATPAPNCRPSPGPTSVEAQVSSSTKSSAEEKAHGEDGIQARGGAPHANGDDRLAAQSIFDRGAWDMSKVNKGFAYVYNSPRVDRKVAWVLSGWEADAAPVVLDTAALDHGAQERLTCLSQFLFSTCTGLTEPSLNLKALAPGAPVVERVEECLYSSGISAADTLALSVALNEQASPAEPVEKQEQKETHTCQVRHHLLALIDELIASNRSLSVCLTIVEAALITSKQKQAPKEQPQEQDTLGQEPRPMRRKKAAKTLSNAWFEWYTRMPRVWNSADRQKKAAYRHVITFMKLFLTEGFAFDPNAPDYKDQVLDIGRRAEKS
ncbi:hypothetical protein PHMEG_00013929 [Phytophthora megakarya]|uniref:Uncharacterized protein n=1 Tax=Phytophthora megakarya TaxID=4795 RepID=A0A225W5J8_9STRA|nr:hypothetical protein PHMEG_00013929 [Phytophthora megakarya]